MDVTHTHTHIQIIEENAFILHLRTKYFFLLEYTDYANEFTNTYCFIVIDGQILANLKKK